MKAAHAVQQPDAAGLSVVAFAVAKLCGGFTRGLELLAPVHVTWDAGLRPAHLARLLEGRDAHAAR